MGVIQEFILREGTDYGQHDYSFEDKVAQVKAQLESGCIKVTYDDESETCNLEKVS